MTADPTIRSHLNHFGKATMSFQTPLTPRMLSFCVVVLNSLIVSPFCAITKKNIKKIKEHQNYF